MHTLFMDTTPWLADITATPSLALDKDIRVDIAIIGSGLTGVSTAYQLCKTKKSIVVIDKADSTQSVTAYTTAFITYVIDTPLTELVSLFGQKKAQQVWTSGQEAINEIEHIVTEEKIECAFTRCSEFLYAYHQNDLEQLEEEYKKAKELGFSLILHKGNHTPFSGFGFLEFPKQAKFHPLKYVLALKKICQQNSVQFFDNTEAKKIDGEGPLTITTPKATITADKVIIATYDPFNHPAQLFAKKGMYKTYVLEAKIPKNAIPEALYLDNENPYHYTRIDAQKGYDRLIIGGEDHRAELPIDEKKSFDALITYLEKAFPGVPYEKVRQWTGPILEPTDGLAYIGKLGNANNLFVAMAFSGNGMTYATLTSLMTKDFVLGKKNPYEELYNPNRIPNLKQLFEKGKDYVQEFFGAAVKNTI